MKLTRRTVSILLALIFVLQCTIFPGFANQSSTRTTYTSDGVALRYNADGTVTATIRTVPSTNERTIPPVTEDQFQDCGDNYVNLSEAVSITLPKTFRAGENLVSIECDWAGISFYPEMNAGVLLNESTAEELSAQETASEEETVYETTEVEGAQQGTSSKQPEDPVSQEAPTQSSPADNAEAVEEESDESSLSVFTKKQHVHFAPHSFQGAELLRRFSEDDSNPIQISETSPVTEAPTPMEAEAPAPVETEAPAPVETETPVETEAPAPVETETPEETEGTAPVETETPVETEAPAPVETETPVETEAPAPVETETLVEAEEPVETETPAPTEMETPTETEPLVPVEIEAPAPFETEAPVEAEVPTEAEPQETDESTETQPATESAAPAQEDEPTPAQETSQPRSAAVYGSVIAIVKAAQSGLYSSVLYPGAINEYTDVELVPKGNGVKENVVMHRYTGTIVSYILDCTNLTPVLSGKRILLQDASGETVGEISAPYLLDANGAYNDNISVSLERVGNRYRLVYKMDDAWLRAAAFPVVLDPSIYIGVDDNGHSWSLMEDGYITSAEPWRNYGYTNQHIACGNTSGEALCLFRPVFPDSINAIADRLLVKEVKLHTYVESVSGTNTYSVYQLLGEWTSRTVTYNNCPAYIAVNTTTHTISSTGWYTWDFTPIASTWFNCLNQMQEYGVLIRGETSGGSLVFTSSDASWNNAYYEITYYPNPADVNLRLNPEGNELNSGTGYLDLSWDAVEGAENYYVGIHNGKEYQYFYVEGASSWTTKGKGIWPTEAEISDGKYQLHKDGSGAELPTIPAFSYNNSGGELAGNVNYALRVIPANQYGQAPNPAYFGVKNARLPDRLPPSTASSLSLSPSEYTNADTLALNWAGILDYNDVDTSAVSSLGTGCVQYALNDTSNWFNTNVSSGDGTASIDVSSVMDGKNYISIRAMDSAGNTGTPQQLYFYIDRTAPTAPVLSVVPGDWSHENTLSLTWSGISDLNELTRVEYSVDGTSYVSTEIAEPSYSGYILDLSSMTDGVHTLRVRGVDIVGNVGEAAEISFYRDTAAPTVEELTADPADWTSSDEIRLSWAGLEDLHSGLHLVWYAVDGGEELPLDAEEMFSFSMDASALSDGEHSVLLHFEDAAGNTLEQILSVLRDVTEPELALLSPTDGSAVNGTVDVLGSVQDLSLAQWQLLAVNEDGESRILAEGDTGKDAELLGVFNSALYEDGERVELKLYAVDKAGNETEVAGTVIIVDKSAVPVTGSVIVDSPANTEQLCTAAAAGSYTTAYESPEAEGLLYIDGVYQGEAAEGVFAYYPILYPENTSHSISILSIPEDGMLQFSQGLSSYVLFSDAYEDESFLRSSSGLSFDQGAFLYSSGTGELVTQSISPAFPLLSLRLNVSEEKPAGTNIQYYYSTDDGETWSPILPETDVPMLSRPESVTLRVELSGSGARTPILHGLTLSGVIETAPTRFTVKLLRPVEQFSISDTSVTQAITPLTEAPEGATLLRQYWNGAYRSVSFDFDARSVPDNERRAVALCAETEEGVLHGTNAAVSVLLRENIDLSETEPAEPEPTDSDDSDAEQPVIVASGVLQADGKLYAIRLEALCEEDTSFAYSTDNSTWIPLTPGRYCYLDQASDTVWLRAEGGILYAWHLEGVCLRESNVSVKIMRAPANVVAADYGADYYGDAAQRYYQLSWADPTPSDSTAAYTTAYEIYRNGAMIATTASTRYTDSYYIANASYEVRTVRRYNGFDDRYSERSAASVTHMKAPGRITGVEYTAEEQKQSDYLDKLYGGNYTFSNEAKAPTDDRALDLSLLGRNKICANGFEPINFNTGNYLLEAADYALSDWGLARLVIDRTYNSKSQAGNGPFGAKWSSTWSEHLRLYKNGDVVYTAADGAEITFTLRPNGEYIGGESRGLRLTTEEEEYRITNLNGEIHAFSGRGLLKYVCWSDGNSITVERDKKGLVKALVLPSGETLKVKMDKQGHITAIDTPSGTLRYSYHDNLLVGFTDTDGSEIRYEYDKLGRMTEWYDAAGTRQVKNSYDEKHRVVHQIDANGGEYDLKYEDDHTTTTDADGNVSEIWYDKQYRTTKTVDANGAEISYAYDPNNNIVAITDALGNTTRYEYDERGNKIKETAPDGSSFSLEYDENNNLTRRTDRLGGVTRYEYDAQNRMVKQINPDGGEISYTYSKAGQVLSVTGPLGEVTTYEYEGVDLVRSTNPNGNATEYAYDEQHRLIETTDALGSKTAFTYDAQDNLVSVTYADGTSFGYEYDRLGNLVSQTDALGNVTHFEYDAMNQLVKIIHPDGSETTSVYDKSGNIISALDANGNGAEASYDGRGRLASKTDALGNVTGYTYDLNGRLAVLTLPNGAQTKYQYTENGQLASVTDAVGEQTRYDYDAAGNITEVTVPDGGVTSFEYDVMGRLVTETAPNGAVTRYTYDKGGRLISKIDALGGVTSYAYDNNSNVLSVTDTLGGVTSYGYDALERVVSVTDACGGVTKYEYDAVGNLVSETDALGGITSYTYDDNGNITELTDALGGKSGMRYDELGNVVGVLQKNGGKVGAVYDPLGHLISETDALGNTTAYEYDAVGKLTKITDALGQSSELFYDALGNVTKSVMPDGTIITYSYDAAGRLSAETSPTGAVTEYIYEKGRMTLMRVNGNETRYAYDLAGNLNTVIDAEGRKLEMSYDALGNLMSILYPDGSADRYEYDKLARLVKLTPREGDATEYSYDAMGDVLTVSVGEQTTAYEYDLLGRVTAVTTQDGARTQMEYDAMGNLVKLTDALGNESSYSYTVDGLLEELLYADGASIQASYDLNGRLVSKTDPEGGVISFDYDPVGHMTSATDPLGAVTRYTYDAADMLVKVTDALGQETHYSYDALGNMTTETDALGNTTHYSYSPEGWMETVTDAEGHVTRYSYDRTGNVLQTDYAGEMTETNRYNELGLLTTVTTAEGETRYQYDSASRLLSVTRPNGEIISYTYDSHGNRASMTYPDGKTVRYAYDEMDRLVSVQGVDGKTTAYRYDALGRRIATDGALEHTEYVYDEVGNLVSQTSTGAYELQLDYSYDRAGRMTQERRTENHTTLTSDYSYDALGQLTGFTRSDGRSERYVYDLVGNMTAKTVDGVQSTMEYNAANQLTKRTAGSESTSFTYDANGNLIRSESPAGTRQYAYNALGLLAEFTREDGYSERYTYNANRLLQSVTTGEGRSTELSWDILYGDGVIIRAEENGQETAAYTYGLERISALEGDAVTEYLYDARGSVAVALRYDGSQSGDSALPIDLSVVSSSYSPFGEQLGEQRSGFSYNGEYYNAETGMIYLRARFYEPAMNRFSQKDLLRGSASTPESLNRYTFVCNDPINMIDPSGKSLKSLIQKGKQAVKNAVNTFIADPIGTIVDAGKKVVQAIAHPVATANAIVKTAGSIVKELVTPDKEGQTSSRTPRPNNTTSTMLSSTNQKITERPSVLAATNNSITQACERHVSKSIWDELNYKGEIHRAVQLYLANKYGLDTEVPFAGGKYRVDLYSPIGNQYWEIKPISYIHEGTQRYFDLQKQLKNYDQFAVPGLPLGNGEFPYGDYVVKYYSDGPGMVYYTFKKRNPPDPVLVPEREPVKEEQPNYSKIFAGGLIVTGGIIIVATIAEDVLSAGAGIADDGLSFAAALELIRQGAVAFAGG